MSKNTFRASVLKLTMLSYIQTHVEARTEILASMCLQAVQELPLRIIDHKFLESGHSQMECDSVHAAVETARKTVPVYTPEGYYTLVRGARRSQPYKVHELCHKDFIAYKTAAEKKIKNKKKDTDGEQVKVI